MIAVVPIVPVTKNKTSPTSKFERLLQSFKAISFILQAYLSYFFQFSVRNV